MTTIRVWTNYAKSGEQLPPQVQLMDLEEYLCGVVPYEMSSSSPLEALKAQAVAARTYALAALPPNGHPRHGNVADVCTTDHCQAWSAKTYPATDAAVLSTAGQYCRFDDKLATTYYFGHCGGRTNTPAEAGWPGSVPWCQPVLCLCKPPRPSGSHGVGMCQDGAVLMAGRSYDYLMILKHYYTGVTIAVAGVAQSVPPSQLGYNSQYVLMSQAAGVDVWATLAPYALKFRVTSGFSHDDALRVHGDSHTITLLGSASQPWSVSAALEQFLRQVAPSNVTVERVEAASLVELGVKLEDCVTRGNPLAYR
jgi:hypothetical protein